MYDIQEPLNQMKLGRAAEAIPTLEALVSRMPGHVTAHVLLAKAYQQEERWQEAMSSWQNASFLMPSSPVVAKGFREVLAVLSREMSEDTSDHLSDEDYEVVSVKIKGPVKPQYESGPEEPDEVLDEASEEDDPAPGGEATAGTIDAREEADEAQEEQPAPQPNLKHLPTFVRDVATREAAEAHEEVDELDRLIQELENARIVPRPDHEDLEAPALENSVEGMASETLATIYAGQRQYDAAAQVYEELARMHPDKAEGYHQKAAEMRDKR